MNRAVTITTALLTLAHGVFAAELPFETAAVELDAAPRERLLDGKVEAVNQATMSAQTAGRIAEVFVDVDDYVEAGQQIVRFTDVEQQSSLRQARAALAEARAQAVQADEQFRRVSDLVEKGSVSRREYDQALAAREAAGARVESAQSSVAAAEQQLEYTLVRAPYAGIVTERHVEVGEAVGIGQPLMSGLSLEALRVVGQAARRPVGERTHPDLPEGLVGDQVPARGDRHPLQHLDLEGLRRDVHTEAHGSVDGAAALDVEGDLARLAAGDVDAPQLAARPQHHLARVRRPGHRRVDAVDGPGLLHGELQAVPDRALLARRQVLHEERALTPDPADEGQPPPVG